MSAVSTNTSEVAGPADAPHGRAAPAVEASGLRKRYGATEVVCGVDLAVRPGECFGLLGPNGAGKSTTLRMILGQTPPSAGTLRVLGHGVPEDARAARARIGVVPQGDNLDPDFTVRENLVSYASFFGLRGPRLAGHIDRLLAFANLDERANTPLQALSGGMRRRLSLARALVNEPELVVLDEPSTGLDPQARQYIWQRLNALVAEGCTLLLTTHYMEEAERLCDRLAIIDHGAIIASGVPADLVAAHIEPHVVEIRGAAADRWQAGAAQRAGRVERVGDTLLLYTREPQPLLDALQAAGESRYRYRPAALEDVFLKLTGRELRD